MAYKIKLLDQFVEEIEEICSYISYELKNIKASNELRKKVMENILFLENTPKMYVKIDKIDKLKKEYRKIIINNFVILYTVDDIKRIVYIVHIYYNGKNYLKFNL